MAVAIDENVLSALRGQASPSTRLPKPLLIKVYVSSLKDEFSQERRMLLELVGPELQSLYDDRQIEIEIVDMHFGTGSLDVSQVERDPYMLHDYLHEIETCYSNSKSVFFLSLIGDRIGRMPLPTHIDEEIYEIIRSETCITDEERRLFDRWYAKQQQTELDNQLTGSCSIISHSITWANGSGVGRSGSGGTGGVSGAGDDSSEIGFTHGGADCRAQYVLKQEYRHLPTESWQAESRKMRDYLEKSFRKLTNTETSKSRDFDENLIKRINYLRCTQIELEVAKALGLSHDKILAVFRQWSGQLSNMDIDTNERLRRLKDQLTMHLSAANHTTLVVPGKCDDHRINPDNEDHETYLSKFKNKVTDKLRLLIEEHIANDPDVIKGRRKTVQEIFHEHSTHVRILREHQIASALISSSVPMRMREKLFDTTSENPKHPPYFITGPHGSGKSTLLAELYRQMPEWFGTSKRVHRIIRFASTTPRSAYNLELLRVICQQISIIFNIPEGYLPKDASFDPIYINSWFQRLLQRVEDMPNDMLFIFIDDLHVLNQIDCDVVTALSWLPAWLPRNLQIVCATAIPIEQLKIIPNQRELFKSTQYDLRLPQNQTLIQRPNGVLLSVSFEQFVEQEFDRLEQIYGSKGFSELASYLTLTQYGLTETEILELLMPTDDPDALIETTSGGFNFSTLKRIHMQMAHLVRDKIMSGKVLIQWRHPYCAQLSRRRYMEPQSTRQKHIAISNLFFQPEPEENDDENSTNDTEESDGKQSVVSQRERDSVSAGRKSSSHQNDDTSTFYNPIAADVSYSVRHVEESWHHLMRSDDTNRFKQIAVCNFDFLLAAVQTVSISYLRCLIEHVRCYLLDRDIELIYNTIRKSSDVLTRDPMQLGAQLISWLRPISEHDENDNSLLSITVRQATAWCDGYAVPLLVPLTGWLPVPLPSQIRTMTVPGTGPVRDVCVGPTKQHIILATNWGDVQLWHIMSNSLEHTFKGHTAAVTCTALAPQSDILLTGSEDTTVIIWNVTSRELRTHIKSHTAAVTSVAVGVNNTLAISSSDDSTIIISDIYTGITLHKITYHRGAVKCIKVCGACDVLISSSVDKMICLWSLDDYTLLNSMQMCSPVLRIDISCDSVFLLALCEDNNLYVRTLATGKELHVLKGHKAKVCTIDIAKDNRRAVVGCSDLRAVVYDMHSGRLVRWMPPSPGAVTAVHTMENDDFLIIVGGNKITFYSFRNEELQLHPYSHNQRRKRSLKRASIPSQRSPSTSLPPITCFDISRDSQLVAIASGRSIHMIKINTPEYQTSYDGHVATVTCLNFAPNGEFLATGSEDRLVHIWNLALGQISHTFKGHNVAVTCLVVLMDSRRIMTSDVDGYIHVWLAEGGSLLQTIQSPCKSLAVTNNMKFAVSINGDNAAKIWSLTREDEKYTVTHVEEITCFAITTDSLYVITGSKDNSLKVWQATGGKLAQVLVGHSDTVTCVAVSVTNKTQVISGSRDTILFIWDLHTGEEIHTLAGHLGAVMGVKVSADGSTAVSASEDKTLIVWETKRGLALTSLQLHVPFTNFDISLECSRILVQLVDSFNLPVICLHNTPAQYVKLPTYSAPARDVEDLRPQGPKRQMKRLLKKEVSLDTYTWQKKYGHLTSSVMMAQVDERLKRRFSVSASMEEISKAAEMKTMTSQTNLGPEQAALAQSQHFDQLEALWNKRSPPRRRHNAGLSRQTSLVEDRIESSDDDEYHDERAGMLSYASFEHLHCLALSPRMPKRMRPLSLPMHAACVASSFYVQPYPIECHPQESSIRSTTTPSQSPKSAHKTKKSLLAIDTVNNINNNAVAKTKTTTTKTTTTPQSSIKKPKSSSTATTTTTPIAIPKNKTKQQQQQHNNIQKNSNEYDNIWHKNNNPPSSSSAPSATTIAIQQRKPDNFQPDLVKDLWEQTDTQSASASASPTRRQRLSSFFRNLRHMKSTMTKPNNETERIYMKAHATPIIIVENYDHRTSVLPLQTHTVLHPRPKCAAWGHLTAVNDNNDNDHDDDDDEIDTKSKEDAGGEGNKREARIKNFFHRYLQRLPMKIFRKNQSNNTETPPSSSHPSSKQKTGKK